MSVEPSQTANTKFAAVFPGQGSQSVGMLAELAQSHACVIETFKTGSDILGYDAWALSQTGPEEKIGMTEITQPLMLLAGVAAWRVWRELNGPWPSFMAGHSLGEYSALVCAESISLESAITVVQKRAQYMQETVPEGQGAMAVFLGLSEAVAAEVCQEASPEGEVAPANFNAPGQVVVGGLKPAIEKASQIAKERGCKRISITNQALITWHRRYYY